MTPDEWRDQVGRQIEAARKASGIRSMRAAALAAGFSEATWRQLESGKRQLAPGHVVAPSPKPDTLIAAARVTGLDPVQLMADAGGSAEDLEYAEDYVHRLRNAIGHASIVQTMRRNAEGVLGFETGDLDSIDARLLQWVATLPQRDRDNLVEMVRHVARQAAMNAAESILENLGVEGGAVADEDDDLGDVTVPTPLAIAAHHGGDDPHDEEVGPATASHPGGADPASEPGA